MDNEFKPEEMNVFAHLMTDDDTPAPAYVTVSFIRPDGDGTFRSTYNLSNPVDLANINRNIADGYRVTSLAAATEPDSL